MPDTAIAAALKKAGANPYQDQLAALAWRLLAENGRNAVRAVGPLTDAIRREPPSLLSALIDYATIRESALKYLDRIVMVDSIRAYVDSLPDATFRPPRRAAKKIPTRLSRGGFLGRPSP